MTLDEEFVRQAQWAYPGHPLAQLGLRVVRELREKLAQVQAELDEKSDYQVFLVPGYRYVEECKAMLTGSPDVREGDRLRVSDTGCEFVYRAGIWWTPSLLTGVE